MSETTHDRAVTLLAHFVGGLAQGPHCTQEVRDDLVAYFRALLPEAVAASGSPPSPRMTLNMDEIEGAVEVDESAIALDLERDRIVFPLDVMSGSGSLIFEVRIPLSAVLRASSGSPPNRDWLNDPRVTGARPACVCRRENGVRVEVDPACAIHWPKSERASSGSGASVPLDSGDASVLGFILTERIKDHLSEATQHRIITQVLAAGFTRKSSGASVQAVRAALTRALEELEPSFASGVYNAGRDAIIKFRDREYPALPLSEKKQ